MLRFYKQEIKWQSLSYKKGFYEQSYQEEKMIYQRWTFRIFFTLLVIITFILWMAGFGSPNRFTQSRIATNIVRIFSPFLVQLIVKRHPKWIELIIIIVITVSSVFYMEANRSSFPSMGQADIFLNGLLIQTLCVFLILVQVRFPILMIMLFLINLYTSARIFYFENFDKLYLQSFIICLSNSVFLSTLAYGREIYQRKIHFEMKNYENSLSLYEKLIKDIIPLSVIIYDDKEIYFNNRETNRILKISETEDIKEKLEEITVIELKNLDSDSIEPYSFSRKSDSMVLGNLLTIMRKIVPRNEDFSCTVSLLNIEGLNSEETINLKFKISRIVWNDKKAKIILISEDFNAKEVKILHQREAFKDKFLATISHELRTPLNGTIGMVSVAKENCSEKRVVNW